MTDNLPDASLLAQNHSAELGAAAEAINQLLRNHTLRSQLTETVSGDDPRSNGVVFDDNGSIAFLCRAVGSEQLWLQVDISNDQRTLYSLVGVYGALFNTIGISDRHVVFMIAPL